VISPGRRRLLTAASLAALAGGSLAFGALVADPLGAVRWAGEASFRHSGAREEFFRGPSGVSLRTWVLGPSSSAPPVVLLHGLGAASHYWAGTVDDLVRSGRTVIVPDAPGSGGSEPPGTAGWGLAGRVEALRSLVEALGLPVVDIVGHSLGGWTAARFAIEEPRRVRRLVLVDPGGFSFPPGGDDEGLRFRLTPTNRAGGRALVDLLFFRKPFPSVGFVADAVARNYSARPVAATVAALTRSDGLIGREGELPEGTVLVWGGQETLFPLEDGRRAASRLRNGRLLVITGVGHDGPLEARGAFRDALGAALSGGGLPTIPAS
jgi:4,5:9,10-diseco-3-hydroxy-5,9,17-trioxoandrosta-1(10),2-diene-4-oate hydrolase